MPTIHADVDCIVLVIDREEVERLQVGRAVDDLMTLSESPQLRRQLAHGVLFTFSGWDEDPREVTDIPECRAYMQALHAHWRYWLHFLAPLPDIWAILLLCLVDGKPEPQPDGRLAKRIDPEQVQQVVAGMVLPLAVLHKDMGLPDAEHKQVLQKSIDAIGTCWV